MDQEIWESQDTPQAQIDALLANAHYNQLQSHHASIGFLQGVDSAQSSKLQSSFDQGYSVIYPFAFELGKSLGLLQNTTSGDQISLLANEFKLYLESHVITHSSQLVRFQKSLDDILSTLNHQPS